MSLPRADVEAIIAQLPARRRRIAGVVAVVAAVIAAIVFIIVPRREEPQRTKQPAQIASSFQAVINEYLGNRPLDQWLITRAEVEGSDMPKMMLAADNVHAKLDAALHRYADLPLVRALADSFGSRMYVTYYSGRYGGTTISFSVLDSADAVGEQLSDKLEVVLYAREYQDEPRIASNFAMYDPQWRAVIVGAVAFTEPWFDALALHELEHARRDRANEESAHAPRLSDSWIGEELAAHDLEAAVLDRTTKGKYNQTVQRIAERHQRAASIQELTNSLTIADFRSLDEMFPPAGEFEASIRSAQYLMSISDRWLAFRAPGGVATLSERADVYRQFLSQYH